jgi:hypothetical protein
MNEPKKRGRPSAADKAAQAGESAATDAAAPAPADDRAQAYALRIWSGQSESLGRGTRIERVKAALDGQGLSFDGVKLPGTEDGDDDWTAEDEQPVTWRKASE